MRANSVLTRNTLRSRPFAPLIALVATVHTLYGTFRSFDTSRATWRTALEGINQAVAATRILLLTSILLVTIYELVRGRGDDHGAA
jgi:biopolymer transport protein ExbB/TolQ